MFQFRKQRLNIGTACEKINRQSKVLIKYKHDANSMSQCKNELFPFYLHILSNDTIKILSRIWLNFLI